MQVAFSKKNFQNHVNNNNNSLFRLTEESRQTALRWDTFSNFPRNVPVDSFLLACSGFCYTGRDDIVTCYSCGNDVQDWQPGDDGNLEKLHKSNCCFAKDHYSKEAENLAGSCAIKKPTAAEVLDAEPGFNKKSTESHWPPSGYDPSNQRAFVTDGKDVVPPMLKSDNCYKPINGSQPVTPSMNALSDRLQSFESKIKLWKENYHHNLTPLQLAEAGFFYTGKKDSVKCWYCNINIYDWEENDDAWVEHAKWSSECKFVQRNKGTQFVKDCQCKC